jgi:Ca2+-binding RTX toxin-like protein
MSVITEYYKEAELALASYANLTGGMSNTDYINALRAAAFSAAQASAFAAKWNVVTQYTDPVTGVSATVFQAVAGGPNYIAIRGTELDDPGDIAAAGIILTGFIPLDLAAQYILLKTQVQSWLSDGTLAADFSVSGHSLGGYLAIGLEADFGTSIGQAYLYNAPGLNGVLGSGTAPILEAFGITAPVDPSKILNIKADAGISPIAGVGAQVAPTIDIHIENQFLSDVGDAPLSFNHSQRVLTDALALYAMFARIDPAASVESITEIIKASSAQNGNTLETSLDALRTLFQQNYQYGQLDYDAVPTMTGDSAAGRDDYYVNLQSLQTWWEASPFNATGLSITPLAEYGGAQIAAMAMADDADGQAYRYALYKLNPFAVTGSTALYDGINVHGELSRYNPATGTGSFTDQYLTDRAFMLSWKLQFGTHDTEPVGDTYGQPQSGTPFYFEDFTNDSITIKMRIGGGDSVNAVMGRPLGDFNLIVFGAENNDAVTGQGKADRLYGGAGDDTLTGNGGSDYLEGGQGFDAYVINTGDGYDTVLDSDGLGVIKFGLVEAKGSTDIDPTKWIYAESSDSWVDQQNGITYSKSIVEGETRILIHKGDSNVLVKGWSEGELGITLAASAPSAANKTYTGSGSADFMMNWDLAGWGWDGSRDAAITGLINRYEGLDGADFIQTDFVDDSVEAGGGNDYILAQYGGADVVNGGLGNDYIHVGDPDPMNDGGASSLRGIPSDNRAFVDGGDGDDTITVTRQYAPMAIALDGAAAGLAYSLQNVAGFDDFAAIWADGYANRERAPSTFYVPPGTPAFTFTGWQRDGASLAQGTDGQLNFYPTFQFPTTEFSTIFAPYGPTSAELTRFTPVFIYQPSQDNDDTTGHTLFGGAGNDMVEGGFGGDFIDGGAGNDALDGERGADMVLGGAGDDLILGGEGDDWLEGGLGNDEIYGEQGNDTYVFARGTGVDRISDFDTTAGNLDVVHFQDVDSDEVVSLERNGNDLVLRYGMADQLTVVSYFSITPGYKIEQFEFSDGVIWDEDAIFITATGSSGNDSIAGYADSKNLIYGLEGDDHLEGGALADTIDGGPGIDYLGGGTGDDTLIGGTGNDTLGGHYGNDTYVFAKGSGVDLLYDWDTTVGNIDAVQFLDVKSTELTVSKLDMSANLILSYGEADQITVLNYFKDSAPGQKIEQIQFIDGVVWGETAIMSHLNIMGSEMGNDVITGFSGWTNRIYGMGGDDYLVGGALDDLIDGGAGNDTLNGGAGADTLIGGTGNDTLHGGDGDNIFIGGEGDDILSGQSGNDTYVFAEGAGVDRINAYYMGTNADVVQFLDVASTELTALERNGNDLFLDYGTADQLMVTNYFDTSFGAYAFIRQFRFSDGVTWDEATIKSRVVTLGNAYDDWIDGYSDVSNRIYGLDGNDFLSGGALNDLLDGGTGNDYLWGGPGNDILDGGAGDDTLVGGAGVDMLIGGAGNDEYIFGKGSGQDTVDSADTTVGKIDTVLFDSTVDPSEVLISRLDNDLVLAISGTTDSLTIQNYMENDAASAYTVEQIKFQDGTLWDVATVRSKLNANQAPELSVPLQDQVATESEAFSYTIDHGTFTDPDAGDTLAFSAMLADGSTLPSWLIFDAETRTFSGTPSTAGTLSVTVTAIDTGDLMASDSFDITVTSAQDLSLNGTSGADTLAGGPGNDALNGLAGNDVLDGYAGNDVLDGGAGNDTMAGGAGDDIYIVNSAADIIIEGLDEGMDSVLSRVTYTLPANIENLTLTGTGSIRGTGNALDNIITGNGAANTISGGTGADTLIGAAGNDTYVVDNILDVVTENLNEGTDLVKSSVTFTLAASIENLTLTGTAANNGTGNELDNVLTGNSATNTLTGAAGDDYLNGKAGIDTMIGGTGDDTFVADTTLDVVIEDFNEGVDTVESSKTFTLSANVENLILTGTRAINGTGNTLDNIINGNSAANKLTGATGNDTLDGGSGNDTLTGGTGNDTYVMGRGYGLDTVVENDATAGHTDIAQFLGGISTDQIWFKKASNNLEVSIIGTNDNLVIKDWYLGNAYHVEQFRTTDDIMTLLDSNVQNLVNAMASFAPPAAGQTTLPSNYQDALAGVIAANWQ